MAGGKRKMLNRKTRNKRQNKTENTEENSSAKALEDTSSQGKKPKLEETEENEEKRPLSVQVDLTTTTEPTTSVRPKSKDEDVSRKASKYIPPFSRTRKSGNTEEESGSKTPATRSSTRKRNLLQVLADVAKQKLDSEDRDYENNSLLKSENTTESCPANRIEEEQEQTRGIQPAKQPKLKELVKIKIKFSLNPRSKGKKKIKACEPEEEELDENTGIEEILIEEKRQETKAVGKNEKKHHKTAGEALKYKTKQSGPEGEEEFNGNTAMKETLEEKEGKGRPETKTAELLKKEKHETAELAMEDESSKILNKENHLRSVPDEVSVSICHTNHDYNEAEYSMYSTDSKLASMRDIPSDSIINNTKMPCVDAVIQACVDYLIQTVEAGISVDVVASDNVIAPGPAIEKRECLNESPTQARNHDGCAKVSCNYINDESTNANLENSTSAISRQIDADQDDHSHPEDSVGDSYREVHAGPIDADIDEKPKAQEAAITNSSKTNCSHADVGDDTSSLKKLKAEATDDNKTVLGHSEATSNDVQHEKELKTGEPADGNNTEPSNIDVIENHDEYPHAHQEKELETNVGDGSKTDCSDVDVVGDDNDGDTCQEKELASNVVDGSKTNPLDVDVVGDDNDGDTCQEKELASNDVDGSKTNYSDVNVVGDICQAKGLASNVVDDSKTNPLDVDVVGDDNDGDTCQEKELASNDVDGSKTNHLDVDVGDDTCQEKELASNVVDGSKTNHSDVNVVGDICQEKELATNVVDGSKTNYSDVDVGDDTCQEKELASNVVDDSKTNHSDVDVDVVGFSDDEVEVLGSEMRNGNKMGCPDFVDDNANVKNLGGDEVHAGSMTGYPDDDDIDEELLGNKMCDGTTVGCLANTGIDAVGDIEVNRKNLDVVDEEAHSGSKAKASDVMNVVWDDHLSEVGNPLQPKYVTNAGNVRNLEHSGRNTSKSEIHTDVAAATDSNLNKENHATIVNPGGGEDGKNTSIMNEVRKSASSIKSTVTDAVGSTAACQINAMTLIPSTCSKITNEDDTSLEDVAVPSLGCVKIQPKTLEQYQNKGTTNQERCTQEQFKTQEKSLTIAEKECSVVNKECGRSGMALPKCGGEIDIDYVIDCTDSQLIAAKPSSVTDGLRYDDLLLEDLMDCTDSQLVDIDNLENQASNNQKSTIDGSSQASVIEDGTTLIKDLIGEVSSIKSYLMDVWNRYEQVKKRRHVTYTPVIKKRK